MEGGGAMEGRGSGIEDWRGEAHLGSLLPMSPRCCPCPLIVSHVHVSWPVSARCCPCPRIIACVHVSFPMSAHCCPCLRIVACICMCCLWSACRSPHPFMFVGGHFCSWAWVVAFIHGQSSSFGGIRDRSWAVCLHSWATAGCGGGEPLVGGGESSGLA